MSTATWTLKKKCQIKFDTFKNCPFVKKKKKIKRQSCLANVKVY